MENFTDVVIRVIPWLKGFVDYADITLKATPAFGMVASVMGFLSCFFLLFMMEADA